MAEPRNLPAPPNYFSAPWQAKAFALVSILHESGVFTWEEWTTALAQRIHSAPGVTDLSEAYFDQWLAALEDLLATRELVDHGLLFSFRDAWRQAASRTPHGSPIELEPEDFAHA